MSVPFERSTELRPAPLLRRLAAMLYDGLLCIGLILVVSGLYTGVHQLLIGAGLLSSERYTRMLEANSGIGEQPLLGLVLLLSLWGFFGYFWRRRGQTLGMQAWKIRIQNQDGSAITWLQALMRLVGGMVSWAAFGVGYLWQLVNPGRRSWTDLASGSVTVFIGDRGKPGN